MLFRFAFVTLFLLLAGVPCPLGAQSAPDADGCGLSEFEAALETGAMALSQGMTEALHRDITRLLASAALRADALAASDLEPVCALRLAGFYYRLGRTARSLGRMEEAETWLEEALARHRQQLGDSASVLADILDDLSEVHYRTGRIDEGFALRERAYALRRATLKPNDPKIAKSLMDLGAAYQLRGELGLSEDFYRRGIAILERSGKEYSQQLGEALLVLAELLKASGSSGEAEQLTAQGLKWLDG
jgi:tetratricopeptide (TPR) repeat protein